MASTNSMRTMAQIGIDANAATVSPSINTKGALNFAAEVIANTGTSATHVVTVQTSPDDSNWTDSSVTVAQATINDNNTTAFRYIRLKVTTLEGGASTVDWYLNAK